MGYKIFLCDYIITYLSVVNSKNSRAALKLFQLKIKKYRVNAVKTVDGERCLWYSKQTRLIQVFFLCSKIGGKIYAYENYIGMYRMQTA